MCVPCYYGDIKSKVDMKRNTKQAKKFMFALAGRMMTAGQLAALSKPPPSEFRLIATFAAWLFSHRIMFGPPNPKGELRLPTI